MRNSNQSKVLAFDEFIKMELSLFQDKRFIKLDKLEYQDLFFKKNLYFFKTQRLQTPETIVRSLMNSFIFSSDEQMLNYLLKKLAVYTCQVLEDGRKSFQKGIDLELNRQGTTYLVDIKSGPDWGNSGQIAKMEDNFKKAAKTLRTSGGNVHMQFVNGCCYGIDDNPDKGGYFKLCGQRFWEFITNEKNFYLKIIEPIGYQAKEKTEQFQTLFTEKLIVFASVINKDFVQNGAIDWNKLISVNSGIRK